MSIAKKLSLLACLLLSRDVLATKVSLMIEEFPPYMDQQARDKGVITHLVVEAFKRVNVRAEINFGSGFEVESSVDERKVLSFMWTKTKPLYKKWYYSNPIYVKRLKFASRGSFDRNINYLYSLRGLRIAMVQGMRYGTQIENYRNRLQIVSVFSDYEAVKKLLAGEVELVIMEPMLLKALLASHFANDPRNDVKLVHTPHLEGVPYYLVCGKRYGNCPGHIKKFNHGLALMEQDGSWATLLEKAETL